MLSIPFPFVISIMLGLLALALYARSSEQAKASCLFLGLCAVTTTVVGLRWTFGFNVLSTVQPILASVIPFAAWYTFTHTNQNKKGAICKHLILPLYITIGMIMKPWLKMPIDGVLFLIYVGYGLALLRCYSEESTLINVSLGNWETVQKAEIFAGFMLLLSALVDSLISLDINFNKGAMALDILAATHLVIFLPLSFAVVIASIDTPTQEDTQVHKAAKPNEEIAINSVMTLERAQQITDMLDKKVRQECLYLDPELTLSKLTRKLGIPAKQISIAVNLVYKQNISKLINSYRIEHAKHSLICSQSSITQIFMNSGFQTKSNFNREFSRLTGMTPTKYRKNNSVQ